jgi:hypothetical protein
MAGRHITLLPKLKELFDRRHVDGFEVIADIQQFRANQSWYADRGISWRPINEVRVGDGDRQTSWSCSSQQTALP